MRDFEREVLERLLTIEHRLDHMDRSLKGFRGKVAAVASGLGAFVAALITYFVR